MLTALVEKPLHGYGIMQEIQDITGGQVRPRVGSLYAVLDRMISTGRVEFGRDEVVDGRLRRYYRLTDSGRQVVADEASRIAANAMAAERRLARWGSNGIVATNGGGL